MFECVGLKDTTVTQFGFQFNGGIGRSHGYEVFKLNMPGSFAGHMFTPGAWSKVASGFALSNYLAGAITAEFEVHVLAGQTQAFYIRGTGRGLISSKTNGYGVYKSDENMKLMVGVGLPSGGAFSDGYGDDFYVNPNFITVHYITDRTPPYAQGSLGDADCPTDYTHITSSADCEAATTALGLCDSSKWTGRSTGIPVGCSHRPNHCGQHDWHWNTATTGRGRADLRPICRLINRLGMSI